MSFSNLEYLYSHLPARFQREDRTLLLKRFLTVFGETLDVWDGQFDDFASLIDPETAPVEWVEFWLDALFTWSWFPWWFTLADKRRLYGNFATHLARRGTSTGIELWLADFGITAKVYKRSPAWGKFVWGRTGFAFRKPLRLVVEIMRVTMTTRRMSAWGGSMAWGKGFYSDPRRAFTDREIEDLIRFQQPVGQQIDILWSLDSQGPQIIREDVDPDWEQVSY